MHCRKALEHECPHARTHRNTHMHTLWMDYDYIQASFEIPTDLKSFMFPLQSLHTGQMTTIVLRRHSRLLLLYPGTSFISIMVKRVNLLCTGKSLPRNHKDIYSRTTFMSFTFFLPGTNYFKSQLKVQYNSELSTEKNTLRTTFSKSPFFFKSCSTEVDYHKNVIILQKNNNQ